MIITAHNPEVDHLEKTYLSQYTAGAAASLLVKNNQNFVGGRRALLGRMGQERSELVSIVSSTGQTQINLTGTTQFAHNADDPLYLMEWDRVRFYRADSENGTYSILGTVDVDVDNAGKTTRYDDVNALATHYYKISFYNSNTLEESELSDPIKATGFERKTAGKVIDGVVRRVRDPGFTVLGIDEYLDVMQEVNDEMLLQSHKPYRFLRKTILLNTVANQSWIALPTDLHKFDYVKAYTTYGGVTTTQQITPISFEEWSDRYEGTAFTPSDTILDVALDEETNRLYIAPSPKTARTGAFELSYYAELSPITDVGAVLQTPTPLIYRYKMLAEFYAAKSETDNQWARLVERYEQKYGNEMVKLQRANRVDVGTPRSMAPKRIRDPHLRKRYHL